MTLGVVDDLQQELPVVVIDFLRSQCTIVVDGQQVPTIHLRDEDTNKDVKLEILNQIKHLMLWRQNRLCCVQFYPAMLLSKCEYDKNPVYYPYNLKF